MSDRDEYTDAAYVRCRCGYEWAGCACADAPDAGDEQDHADDCEAAIAEEDERQPWTAERRG